MYYHATVLDLMEGKAECPFPIDVIPNKMGINLCNVAAFSWQQQEDGQLVNFSIHFSPNNQKKPCKHLSHTHFVQNGKNVYQCHDCDMIIGF